MPDDKRRGFDEQKACLSVVGQLEKSGSSLDVILEHGQFITKTAIRESDGCKELLAFFKRLLSFEDHRSN